MTSCCNALRRESHGGEVAESAEIVVGDGGDLEARDRPHLFPGHSDRLAAGGEHAQCRTRDQQRRRQARARLGHMLAVIEHEQDAFSRECGMIDSLTDLVGCSKMPRRVATALATKPASVSSANCTTQTPSLTLARSWSAAAIAKRVLPMPPGPTSVTSRFWASDTPSSWSSSSRPTKLVSHTGT
jgi:hypothetical protein